MRAAPVLTAAALTVALSLAACGGDENNSAGPVVSSTPVASANAPAGKSWLEVVEATPEGGYRQGNPNAPIKLVEYGSRSCPACGNFANTGVEPLREKYVKTGKVSYEFREFFVHPQDLGIALLGRCVSPEAFFPVLDRMYAEQSQLNANAEAVYQQVGGRSAPEAAPIWARGLGYVDLIKKMGVPEAKAEQCLADRAAIDKLSKQLEAGVAKGVQGTPSFFINDQIVPNAGSWQQVEAALQAAGAR